jgi:sterol 3beta-glucosyltransferase
MRVVLTNFGTTGDVHPYVSLAVELQRHGHQPVLALSPYFESLVSHFGLEFIAVGPDLQQLQNDINQAMIARPEMSDSVDQMHALFAPLASALPSMFVELRDACKAADVLISGPMQPAARMVHELTGLPFVSVQVEHFGGGGTPAFQQATVSLINPFRGQWGLPPLRDPLTTDANSPQLALYAMSRHVSPPPADWPPHYHMTGYFFLDNEGWQPDPALAEFIAAGEPPVVLTFGSMTHGDPRALTELMLEAVHRAGCRAIIQHGWSGLGGRDLPHNLYALGYVAYDWLFPRSACVVHHGGPGTAASVFRAGVPSLFVPHAWDQPIWADLAQGLGCAGPAIPFSRLTAERLAAAIAATLNTPHYHLAAAALGQKIRAEQGVKMARRLIEELVYKVGLHEDESASAEPSLVRMEEWEEKINRRKQYQQRQRSIRREKAVALPKDDFEPDAA